MIDASDFIKKNDETPDSSHQPGARQRCQVFSLPYLADKLGPGELVRQSLNRVKRMVKRRVRYMINLFATLSNHTAEAVPGRGTGSPMQAGDIVRVKSCAEISSTLNNWNQLKGCAFMEEMWPYCGTTQKVLKRVEKFLDERDYLVKKCRGLVILENVMCSGTVDFGACDRSCFFFWREEWLEKMPGEGIARQDMNSSNSADGGRLLVGRRE